MRLTFHFLQSNFGSRRRLPMFSLSFSSIHYINNLYLSFSSNIPTNVLRHCFRCFNFRLFLNRIFLCPHHTMRPIRFIQKLFILVNITSLVVYRWCTTSIILRPDSTIRPNAFHFVDFAISLFRYFSFAMTGVTVTNLSPFQIYFRTKKRLKTVSINIFRKSHFFIMDGVF